MAKKQSSNVTHLSERLNRADSSPASAKDPAKKKRELNLQKIQDRTRLFCDVLARLEAYDLVSVAEEAEVSYSMLWNWLHGDTESPLLSSVLKVAPVIGLDVILVDEEAVKRKRAHG